MDASRCIEHAQQGKTSTRRLPVKRTIPGTGNMRCCIGWYVTTAACTIAFGASNSIQIVVHGQTFNSITNSIRRHLQKNTTTAVTSDPDGGVSSPTTTTTTKGMEDVAKLLWSDEFDVTSGYNDMTQEPQFPNPNIWNRDVGVGIWGWGNDEYQYYTDASTTNNAYVQNGNLHIVARNEYNPTTNTSFTSARLKTDPKLYVQYGTIIAKIQIPNVQDGLWAGFWTLGQNFQHVGWPNSGEIDIMEIGDAYSLSEGNGNKRVISAVHMTTGINDTYYYNYTWTEARPIDLSLDYHIYKLEWTPYTIEMYVDDYRTHIFDIDRNSCNGCEELHQPHYLIFNLAVGGLYNLRQDDIRSPERITAPLPATMKIDYIRIYDNGYSTVTIPTLAPITATPTTATPTTIAPTTLSPTTVAPTTVAPTSLAPTTKAPVVTRAPTKSPTKVSKPSSSPPPPQILRPLSPTLSPRRRNNRPIIASSPTKISVQQMNPDNDSENIFNTKSPTTTDDRDFSSIVDSAAATVSIHYSILFGIASSSFLLYFVFG